MPTTPTNPPPEGDSRANTVDAGSTCPTPPVVTNPSRDDRLKRWTHLGTLRELLDKGASSFGPLKATVTDLAECIGKFDDMLNGKKEYEALKDELEKIFEMLKQHCNGEASPAVTPGLESLCEDIKRELQDVQRKLNRDGLERFREASKDLDDVLRCYNRIRDRLQRVSLNVDISMWKIVDELATDNRLDRLSPARSACYNSAQAAELKRGLCTKGTRTGVFDELSGWVETSNPGSVYWMSGMAGTGKTTISYSLCKDLEASGRLAASFFCSRVLPECRDVSGIIPSIAYQLARFSHPFRFALSSILAKNPDAHTRLLGLQFDTLIVQPFLHVMNTSDAPSVKDTLPENLVVVIDALDECEHKKSTSQILELLLTKSHRLPIKFIVSSRPEPEIRSQMTKRLDQDQSRVVLHELDSHTVQTDIKTYLRSALAEMQLSEDQIAALAKRAGVLFIHAATVVRYIDPGNSRSSPHARLQNVLSASAGAKKKNEEIDELYTTVLKGGLDNPELEDAEKDDIRQVLHTIICAKEPLTINSLSSLLRMNDVSRVHAALQSLWSVLHVSGASGLVTTLHASFPDYMLDRSRSGPYYCDPAVINGTLALGCFDCLRKMRPQFNICGLKSSFIFDDQVEGLEEQVKRVVTTEVFYAARYWAEHLHSAVVSPELVQELEEFLSVRLLLWMEIMNLKSSADARAKAIQLAGLKAMEYPDAIKPLIWDACWFIATFAESPLSKGTPHIYTSMLPFWPESNPITRCYAGRTRGMIGVNGTAMAQRYTVLATSDFDSATYSLTFSRDGRQITVDVGHKVLLLNAPTGLQMRAPLKGHIAPVLSVQPSPNDARTVSLEGHTFEISSVTLSPDGAYLISSSTDDTVCLWDTRRTQTAPNQHHGHTDSVTSVSVSPDGTRIVSGSTDGSVHIWDAESGEMAISIPRKTFARVKWPNYENESKEETAEILRVSFSPDGNCIVVNTSHGPFVFASQSGALCNLYAGHIHPPNLPLCFVVLGLGTIGILLTQSDLEFKSGHNFAALSLLLSYARIILAKILGLSIEALKMDLGLQTPANALHALIIQAVFILVTGVRIFGDTIFGPVDIYSPYISCAEFSSDGTRIVSGSTDGIIRVHNARTNRLSLVIRLPAISGENPGLRSVSFSSDGRRIFSSRFEYSKPKLQVHCADSGRLLADLNDTEWSGAVGFTPDGTRVVESYSDLIFLIDSAMREHLGSTTLIPWGPTPRAKNWFGYATNGSRIAAAFNNGDVNVWDIQTGELLLMPIKGHTQIVRTMAVSPNGKCIVTGSEDKTVRTVVIRSASERSADSSSAALDWEMQKDGWIVDDQSRLLFWVPPDLRGSLMWPRTERVFSKRGWLQLDFKDACIGESWAKCYQPE